jgi:hypothetical protein
LQRDPDQVDEGRYGEDRDADGACDGHDLRGRPAA